MAEFIGTTVQRDIDDLRAYLAETHFSETEVLIKYDKSKGGYYLVRFEREWLTNEEVLALCKILLESRAFQKEELNGIIEKLMSQVVPNDRKTVNEIVKNELFQYIPIKHNKKLLSPIWELSQFISKQEIITFAYTRQDGIAKNRTVKPVAIMFSEFYFYLIGFMADDSKDFPTIFRIDRITNLVDHLLKRYWIGFQQLRSLVIRMECIKFAQKFMVMVYKCGSEGKEIGLKI